MCYLNPVGSVQRLQTRAQFKQVLDAGMVAKTAHFALHGLYWEAQVPPVLAASGVWLGAMVPKRWARRAVTRNAIKRQVYAVNAEFALRCAQGAHVVRLRAGFDRTLFPSACSDALKAAVRAELQQLFGRARTPQGDRLFQVLTRQVAP